MKIRPILFSVVLLGLLPFLACSRSTNENEAAKIEYVEADPGVEQVIIFAPDSPNSLRNQPELQNNVNTWLSRNHDKVEIIRVLQTQGDRYTVNISIFYKKK